MMPQLTDVSKIKYNTNATKVSIRRFETEEFLDIYPDGFQIAFSKSKKIQPAVRKFYNLKVAINLNGHIPNLTKMMYFGHIYNMHGRT